VRHLLQYGGAALIVVEDQEHLSQPCVISGIEEFPPANTGITSIEHYAQEADP